LGPWGSSECLGALLVGWPLSGCPTSSRNWLLAMSQSPLEYRPYGLGDPAVPLPFCSALRFFFSVRRRPRLGDRSVLFSSLAFLQSISQRHLAADQIQSDLTAPLMSFWSLQHMQDAKVHLTRALRARYVPSSGFPFYPRDGFLPSQPGRFYFAPAALLGFTLRSIPLWGGSRRVSATVNPRTVSPLDISPPKQGPARRTSVSGL